MTEQKISHSNGNGNGNGKSPTYYIIVILSSLLSLSVGSLVTSFAQTSDLKAQVVAHDVKIDNLDNKFEKVIGLLEKIVVQNTELISEIKAHRDTESSGGKR